MKFEKLKHIVTITKGRKHFLVDSYDKQSARVIQIDDLRNDNLLKYTNDQKGTFADEHDILIVWDGANAGTVGYGKRGFIGSTIARLRKNHPDQYDTAFIGKFLQTQFKHLQSKASGATIPHVNRNSLDSLRVPALKIEDQIRIATVLSKANALIAQRKESLRMLDELLKSTFLEMFGGVATLRNKHLEKLGSYIDFMTSGSRGWAQYYSDQGKPFLRIQNVGKGRLILDDIAYVKPPATAEAIRTKVKAGDLLVSITADLGRTATVPESLGEAYINQHLALIRFKEGLNPVFAAFFYAMPFGYRSIQKKNREGVKAGLNFDDLRSLPIYCPDPRLQSQFAQIVEKVEALKTHDQASLKELENLYGSLSQRAFKGELDLSRMAVQLPAGKSKEKVCRF